MSPAFRCCWFLALAVAVAGGCRRGTSDFQASRPQHPLFKDLKEPPINLPRPATSVPDTAGVPTVPRGGVLISSQGRSFQGRATDSGMAVIGDGRVEFTATKQPGLNVRYQLPKALPAVPYKGPADVTVVEESQYDGPNTQVLIRTGNALLSAAITIKSSEPNRIEVAPGTLISQLPAEVNGKNRIVTSGVQARDASGGVTMIPVGQVTRVRFAGAILDVFVRSSYRVVRGAKEQHDGGYILEASAVRSNQP